MQASSPRAALRAVARASATALVALPTLSALSLVPSIAFAQSSLDPVVVIGTREPQALSKSVADVVLIDRDTLRDSGAASVEEVLRRYAGLQILQNGGPGQTAGYLLRGTNTNSTVVMIDGLRIGSATLGQAAFEALSLDQIERIEVLRGPASGLYGSDAVGGVIQIFTKRGQGPLNITSGVAIGEYDSRKADFALSGAQAGFDYAASIGRETSDGVSSIRPNDINGYYNPDRDGFRRTAATARLGFTPVEGHRIGVSASQNKLNAQYDSANFNPPDYLPDATPDFRNRLTTRVVSADYRGTLSPIWTTTVLATHGIDDSRSGAPDPVPFKTTRDQATWQNALRLAPDQQLLLAYEHLSEKAEGVVTEALKRTNNAYIAGYTGQFGATSLQANLRRDDSSAYGGFTTGTLGASYALTETLKVRALAGTSFRAPTFNDLYFPFYGRADIQPERGRSIEFGVNWRSGASSAAATVYRNKVRDLIVYNPDPTGTECPAGFFGCADNIGRAKLQGATLSGAHRFGNLSLTATVDFLDARNVETGARLPRRAAHQESVSADYDTGVWSVGASLTEVGARPDAGAQLGAYAVTDLRATWRFLPQWRLEAKVLNATDRDVQPVYSYQGLGRQAWVGVRYDMKGF